MDIGAFTTKHPEWEATEFARHKGRELFEAGDVVKNKGRKYLFQNRNEYDEDYEIRLNRAVIDPYVSKIVMARQAILFRKQHSRSLPSSLERIEDNVDRSGTSAQTFFFEASLNAQIEGAYWTLVDMPKVDRPFMSRREEEEAGHEVFFEHIPADNVIDWEEGDDGQLDWAVIEQTFTPKRESPGQAKDTLRQWKFWFRDHWELYTEYLEWVRDERGVGKWESGAKLDDENENPTGVVPLVPHLGAKRTKYSGVPVMQPIFGHVILIYNKQSDLDWFELLSSHPIPYLIGPEKPDKLDTNHGLYMKSMPDAGNVEIGYLEPSGSGFDSMRKSIESYEQRIREIALHGAKKDSAQVESAAGQRESRYLFQSSLSSVAEQHERAEAQAWKIAALWKGEDPEQVEVAYNRDFDDKTIEKGMVNVLNDLVESNRLSSETFLRLLQEGELLPDDIEVEEEVERAKQERDEAVGNQVNRLTQEESPGGLFG